MRSLEIMRCECIYSSIDDMSRQPPSEKALCLSLDPSVERRASPTAVCDCVASVSELERCRRPPRGVVGKAQETRLESGGFNYLPGQSIFLFLQSPATYFVLVIWEWGKNLKKGT